MVVLLYGHGRSPTSCDAALQIRSTWCVIVFAELESGKKVQGDALVYAIGRQANGDQLHLEAAGLAADSRGKVKVNEFFQTDL